LSFGVPVLLIGVVLWLSGDRFSAAVIGLLGAAVGAVGGLWVSRWLGHDLLLSMIIGAAVLAGVSVLLRHVIIVILATVIFASLSGTGYLMMRLDSVVHKATTAQTPSHLIQSFTHMDPSARQAYVDDISGEQTGFSERFHALLMDTIQIIRPHTGKLLLAVFVGGTGALVFFLLIKKVLIALAYSVVGTTAVLMGLQAKLLALGYKVISVLSNTHWELPIAFMVMILFGCLCQLVWRRARRPKIPDQESEPEPSPAQKTRRRFWRRQKIDSDTGDTETHASP
jgi:hypothetical protein